MTVPTVGVSSCLLGQPVRYNGGHKQQPYITGTLARYCRLLPVCPEVESGMGVPRAPMRLQGDLQAPSLVVTAAGTDLTVQMLRYCREKTALLEREELCGFILKSRSPSCGVSVQVRQGRGMSRQGRGLFARSLLEKFPLLPVVDEQSLSDPGSRTSFLTRVFTRRRWLDYLASDPTPGGLISFHTRHKFLLMAHSPSVYRQVGALVAGGTKMEHGELLWRYEELLMQGLSNPTTVKKHTDVMMHMAGFLKNDLNQAGRDELLSVIEKFRLGEELLEVPMGRLKECARRFGKEYLLMQLYFEPYPADLNEL